MAVQLALLLVTAAFSGKFTEDNSLYAAQVRNTVMARPGFSKFVAPKSDRSATAKKEYGGHYADSGTDVEMLTVHREVLRIGVDVLQRVEAVPAR